MRIKKRLVRLVVVLLAVVLVLGGAVLVGHDFRFTQRPVTIPGPDGRLDGVLTTPRTGEARGLVVMVHGDGPADATLGGLYAPWFEGAADAGYATLSWSKPGVGGSEGDWLAQTMTDRAEEVGAALDWAHREPGVPTGRVVLWGASQAGWVLPKVVASRDDVDAVVAVGPAVSWLRQGRYDLLTDLDDAGAGSEERQAALADSDRTRELLLNGASYEEYLRGTTDEEPMSARRWEFARLNVRSDATEDLRAVAGRDVPVHLLLGSLDRNVDVDETERVYRSLLGADLTVERFTAPHSLARPVVEDVRLVGALTATFWPRALLAPGVVEDYERFLADLPS
ncbi:alpha/beta hydrolase family protein [Thalassiella azotivora]